jgi:hypothetical protein
MSEPLHNIGLYLEALIVLSVLMLALALFLAYGLWKGKF